tara:strand:+ start:206 stop:745 length:540 start_codon:yes stop_codon:yes gene_type:complete
MEKVAKKYKEYFCEYCNYKCSNKTNFEKHLTTQKHNKQFLEKKKLLEISGNEKIITNFICPNCKKYFKTNSGLWKHNKNCEKNTITELLKITEEQDKEIEEQVKAIEEKEAIIKGIAELLKITEEKDKEIEEKYKEIEEKDKIIEEKDKTIEEKDKTIEEKDKTIKEFTKLLENIKIHF